MGRTIHYTIKSDTIFTKKNLETLRETSLRYNSGNYENVWTCENFFCDPFEYYPNWDNPIIKHISNNNKNVWDFISKKLETLYKEHSHLDALKILSKKGLINGNFSTRRKEIGGFTKTQGNEFNSLLVYLALIEISLAIPKSTITIHDEGEFLLCNVTLRNGKAVPDINDLRDDVEMFAAWVGMSIIQSELDTKELPKSIIRDIGLDTSYGKELAIKYTNEKLRNLDLIVKRIKKDLDPRYPINIWNIQTVQYDPMLFTRTVDVKQYQDYGSKTWNERMMDGFSGEGFGLTDEDPYYKAVDMFNTIQSMLAKPEVAKLLDVESPEDLTIVNGDGEVM